jgi:septum formation protein
MHEVRNIVLASASPRRRDLLASLGFDVVVRPPHVPEGEIPGLTPLQLSERHAGAKADAAVATAGKNEIVVAADTVVNVDGTPFGKPRNGPEAAAMLRTLAGRDHHVHTAVVLVDMASGRRLQESSTTRVWFYPLDEPTIASYLATGEPFGKAGAYGIQGRGATVVERIDGDFYTVMGLPLGRFAHMLADLGYRLPVREDLGTE